jgi:hypothetical protein
MTPKSKWKFSKAGEVVSLRRPLDAERDRRCIHPPHNGAGPDVALIHDRQMMSLSWMTGRRGWISQTRSGTLRPLLAGALRVEQVR